MSTPNHRIEVDASGMPTGVIDLDEQARDSAKLAYLLAATSENREDLVAVFESWRRGVDDRYAPYVMTGALARMSVDIVAPLIALVEQYAPQEDIRTRIVARLGGLIEGNR